MNTGIGELPPGAELSDNDDYNVADADDPHRALNVDLDVPLREDERLPVLEHRAGALDRSPNILNTEITKREKVIIYFTRTPKIIFSNRNQQFFFLNSQASKKLKTKRSKTEKREAKHEKDVKARETIDLWLGNDLITHVDKKRDKEASSSGKSRKKGTSEDKQKRRRKIKDSVEREHSKPSDYEEATGISTPSAEILPNLNDRHDGYEKMHKSRHVYKKLARDERIEILYEIKPKDSKKLNESYKLGISVQFKNIGPHRLKDICLSLPETLTLKSLNVRKITIVLVYFFNFF